MAPTLAQLALVILSLALFAAGGAISLLRLRRESAALALGSRACLVAGLAGVVGALVWHSAAAGNWSPVRDNFGALLCLAALLALFVLYTQRSRPLAGLEWFVMPITVLLTFLAVLFGRLEHRSYHSFVGDAWSWVHTVTSYGGTVAFAVAAAGGAMYLILSRRLRRKAMPAPNMGNLERLERLSMHAVTLGFALLTVGLVTGIVKVGEGKHAGAAKVMLAVAAWVVYAVVLHAPINPRFRGRRAAMLSLFGFLLLIGTLIAVQFVSGDRT